MRIKEYPELGYSSVELDLNEEIPVDIPEYIRLSVPESFQRNHDLVQAGFALVDRTIEVKVPVSKSKIDFQKFCRLPVKLSGESREEILCIAKDSFKEDNRFQVTFSDKSEWLREKIIDHWIDEADTVFLCFYKDEVAGFANVVCTEEYDGMPFIHLAAIDPRYRVAGAAMSLYAGIFEHYRNENVRSVYGRISSRNMAVMNLYASFGAQFAKPYDIYIKR